MSIFPTTQERFRQGIETLNAISGDAAERLPLLLSRILGSIHEPSAAIFSSKEETQLCDVLGLGADGVRLAVQTAAFIFERAALHSLKAPALLAALADAGLSESNVRFLNAPARGAVWSVRTSSM